MGCQVYGDGSSGTVYMCSPTGFTYRTIAKCPTCKRRTRHLVSLYVWYGPDMDCVACGDRWSEGLLVSRPAVRGWRAERTARLRAQWPLASTRAAAEAALWDEVRIYTEPDPVEEGALA